MVDKSNIEKVQGGCEEGVRTKRIAKNSLLLFLRIFCITIINLFAVRYIIKGLGETDYGIYNAVAGVVLASSFVIPVLAISVQRFFSYARGKKDDEKLKSIFSVSVNITIILSLLIFLFMEIGGVWFIDNQMTIPVERLCAAHWIFQFSLISFILSLAQIPYTAAMFANEDMGVYALVSTIDCIMKFIIAFMIAFVNADHLVYYVAGLCVESMLLFAVYIYIGKSRYPECKYLKVKDDKLYKELLSFSGWTLYGAIAATGLIQGSSILLNVFFGPVANAAYGVAYTVYNAFNALSNSVVLAFRPVMIQMYAEEKHDFLLRLFYMNNKLLLYLLVAVSLPIMLEIDDILVWWLGDTAEGTALFCRLFIIYGIFLALHNPITTIIQSTANIRTYSLLVESVTILNIPLGYFLFKSGMPAFGIFISMISLCAIAQCVRVVCLKNAFSLFSIGQYVMRFVLPAVVIIVTSYYLSFLVYSSIEIKMIRFVTVVLVSPCITFILAIVGGLQSSERKSLLQYLEKIKTKEK